MQTISLSSLPCLGKKAQFQRLNSLIEISSSLMPHQVATATGCSADEALALLLLLLRLSAVEGLLLVYHNEHLDDAPPVMARKITDGFPQLPFCCDICQKEIVKADEISYDFLFQLKEDVRFIE